MEKGIIVVDVPEKCSECIFSNPDGDYCPFHGAISYVEYDDKKPDWCPIRPLPEKMEVCGTYPQPDGITASYKVGWNACIDEILKEE